jgi:hypothetical protein
MSGSIEKPRRILACRVLYRNTSFSSSDKFLEALRCHLRMQSDNCYCGYRFVEDSGEVCYDVLVVFPTRRFVSSALFALPGDSCLPVVVDTPRQGEYLEDFKRRIIVEFLSYDEDGNVFGTLHSSEGSAECSTGSAERSLQSFETEQVEVAGRLVHKARNVASGLNCSTDVLRSALQLQQQRVLLSELELVRDVMRDRGVDVDVYDDVEDDVCIDAEEVISEEDEMDEEVVSRSVGNC